MAQCPTCGSPVPDNVEVCPDCGMDLQSIAPPSPLPAPPLSPAPQGLAGPAAGPQDAGALERTLLVDPAPAPPSPILPAPPTPAPIAPAAAASLTLKRGGALTADKFTVGDRAVVGRFDPESGPVDVDMAPLPEAVYVSRHHAEVRRDESGQWFVKDLGSRNGTFVRSAEGSFQRVTGDQPIKDGDEVSLGNARFEFHTDS